MFFCSNLELQQLCYVRLFPSLYPECRELSEAAALFASVKPLEECPQEAKWEVLDESSDLLSAKQIAESV